MFPSFLHYFVDNTVNLSFFKNGSYEKNKAHNFNNLVQFLILAGLRNWETPKHLIFAYIFWNLDFSTFQNSNNH